MYMKWNRSWKTDTVERRTESMEIYMIISKMQFYILYYIIWNNFRLIYRNLSHWYGRSRAQTARKDGVNRDRGREKTYQREVFHSLIYHSNEPFIICSSKTIWFQLSIYGRLLFEMRSQCQCLSNHCYGTRGTYVPYGLQCRRAKWKQ